MKLLLHSEFIEKFERYSAEKGAHRGHANYAVCHWGDPRIPELGHQYQHIGRGGARHFGSALMTGPTVKEELEALRKREFMLHQAQEKELDRLKADPADMAALSIWEVLCEQRSACLAAIGQLALSQASQHGRYTSPLPLRAVLSPLRHRVAGEKKAERKTRIRA